MDSTTKNQGDEDISPEELKRRMVNLQRTPKRRAAWLRYLYSKKKWKVEYLMAFLLATKETVEREIALVSQGKDTVSTTADRFEDKKVFRPMKGMAAFEDERYLPPPKWFEEAARKFRARVREINRQQKLTDGQKTEENDQQMKQPAPPIHELKKLESMSEERAAIVARIGSEIAEELKMKKNKNIEIGSTRTDAHTTEGGNAKRRKKSKKPKTPAIVVDDSDIEEVPDPRQIIAADAKVDPQPLNNSITTVPRKKEMKKRVLIDSKDSGIEGLPKNVAPLPAETIVQQKRDNKKDYDKSEQDTDPRPDEREKRKADSEHDEKTLNTRKLKVSFALEPEDIPVSPFAKWVTEVNSTVPAQTSVRESKPKKNYDTSQQIGRSLPSLHSASGNMATQKRKADFGGDEYIHGEQEPEIKRAKATFNIEQEQAAKLKRIINDLEKKDERNESQHLFEVASFSEDPNLITRWTTIQDELGVGSDDDFSEEEEEEIDELADDDEYFRDESSNATGKKTDIRGWVGVSFSGTGTAKQSIHKL